MATARGQITIVDLNDAKTLNLYLASNHPSTQVFNKENSSYVPNYSATGQALVITPEVYVSGTATNAIAQVKAAPRWSINGSTNLTAWGSASPTSPYALTINKNLTSVPSIKIECEIDYTDPASLVVTKAKAHLTITKTENAGQLVCAIAYAPKGTIFKQGVSALEACCDMWRGSVKDKDKVAYQWSKLSSNGSWEALSSTQNYGCTGFNADKLIIPSSAVLNYESFKCEITDTDPASGTYNTRVADILSFVDLTDPYQVEIISPGGDKLVNGQGSLTLTAEVWQRGVKLTNPQGVTFSWSKYDKDGRQDTTWGTGGTKSGATLTITRADVSIKGTFVCSVTIP